MYIHLGENFVVPSKEVVMIVDRHSSRESAIVGEFLAKQQKKIIQLTQGEAKSIIITKDNIYFSPLASSTLKKRAHVAFNIDI